MVDHVIESLTFLLRWLHVVTAIAWVGSSFYFVFLDSSLTPPEDPDLKRQLQVQFVTVDPEHDTPNVVRDYLARFDSTFTGLTGKAETIDEAARKMFVGNVKPLPAEDHTEHAGHDMGSDPAADGVRGS